MHVSRSLLKLLFNSDGIPLNRKTPLTKKLIIRFGLGIFRGVAAFGLTFFFGFGLTQQTWAGAPSPIPAYSPWNLAVLTNPPAYEVLGVSNGVTGLLFHGPAFTNNSGGFTKVFAYFSEPSSGQPPYPTLVLVHGGGGRANLGWVQGANQRGYAALALTTTGVEGDTYWTNDVLAPYRGPSDGFSAAGGPSPFDDTGWGDTNMWIYHAVADTILADSLVRTFPGVDTNRVGLWGASWGAFHTWIVAGLDSRFRAACTEWGCGYMHEDSAYNANFASMTPGWRNHWIKYFDPSMYVGTTQVPMFMYDDARDLFFPLDSHSKTYALVQSPKKINIDVEGVHGVSPDAHVQSIWNYFAEQLQGQGQMPVISRPVVNAGLVAATLSNAPSLASANLNYTTGPASANSTRVWTTQPCTFSGNQITGTAPPTNATAYYISVSDTTDTTYYASIASSEVVVEPENVTHKLTVVDGTTDGNYGGGSYYAGTNILLTALVPSDQFLGWIGNTQNVADINASSTALLMPGQNTTVFANNNVQCPPLVPAGLVAVAGDGRSALIWNYITGASGYNVKRSLTNGGPYSLVVSSLTNLSYIDTGLVDNATYYYVVTGLSALGESANSAPVSVTPEAATPVLPAPAAWLTFNNTLVDQSGHQHNGSFIGSAAYGTNVPDTTAGVASLWLPDGSASVAVGNPTNLVMNTSSPFTIACWFQLSGSAASYPTMLIKQPASGWDCSTYNRGGFMIVPTGKLHFDVSCIGGVDSQTSVNDGNWHHGAVVYNGTSYQMYVDGQPDGQGTFGGCNEGANSEPPWVLNISYGFTGRIDEFGFWNSALTPAQISAMMTMGPGATAGNSRLAIICSGEQIILSWNATSLQLQMNTNLNNYAGWTNMTIGTNSPVILTICANSTFYRLSNP
jgi:hypothetical protein